MASASAWTENITARNAGKPATFVQLNPMTAEPVRVVFHLDQDRRLVGVFCHAVKFQALCAGFEADAGEQLARVAGDVCRETFSHLSVDGESVDVTLDTFSDRVEVAIYSREQSTPAIGLKTFAPSGALGGEADDFRGVEWLSSVDRILYNADGGVSRITLVKFLPGSQNR